MTDSTADSTIRDFVTSLAARTPTPGGGAAACHAAAMGAALLAMVVRFSYGKKANAGREVDLENVAAALDRCLELLAPMADRDIASFEQVAKAYGLPKATDADLAVRKRAIQAALVGAMVVPEETLCVVRDALVSADTILDCVQKSIVSDLGAGAGLLGAAGECAFLNVRINAAYLDDRAAADAALEHANGLRAEIDACVTRARARVEALLG